MRFVTSVTSVSNFTYSSNSQSEAQWVSKFSDFFCTFLWFCVSYVSMITWNQGLRCHILRCTSWYHVICIMKCKLTIGNSARWKLMIDYQVSIESQVQSLHVTLFFCIYIFLLFTSWIQPQSIFALSAITEVYSSHFLIKMYNKFCVLCCVSNFCSY